MSVQEVIQLHPSGWEHAPEEEWFKVSTLDRTPVTTYNHYVIFFRVDDASKDRATKILMEGLAVTLSQAKYFCGTIEKHPEGGHCFVKRKESTVKVVIQRLDNPDDNLPTLDEIEKAHFAEQALGDLDLWSIPSMRWGERPEADPNCSPAVAGYQINLARGGIVFSMHSHHYASDVMGWSNFTRQLAENCYAISNGTPFPEWNPKCIDASRYVKDLPEEALVDGPPIQQRHPDHPYQECVLFHLPKSKAQKLKELADPRTVDPTAQWISTYDATCAYLWRMLSKVRAPLYKPDLSKPLWWAEAVNMRTRVSGLPDRMMRNIIAGAFSDQAGVEPQPTAAEVISDAPLSRLATYIRALTLSCTEERLMKLIDIIACIRDKRCISLRVDAHPPMSMFVTDHREGDVSGFDFGFAKPITYRHLWGSLITAGLILIYAPIRSSQNPDEGCMFTITMEKELIPTLIKDPEWNEYFEYRGIDAKQDASERDQPQI